MESREIREVSDKLLGLQNNHYSKCTDNSVATRKVTNMYVSEFLIIAVVISVVIMICFSDELFIS
jgi:hypothetical protein